jgi:hypothetical protein
MDAKGVYGYPGQSETTPSAEQQLVAEKQIAAERERNLFTHCCSFWCSSKVSIWILVVLLAVTAGFAWAAYGEASDTKLHFEDDVIKILKDKFDLEPVD